jgi:PAS domain-containing protein
LTLKSHCTSCNSPAPHLLNVELQAAVLSESAATLVLDHKARVVYATDKLAAMLGYPVASLLKMELGALLPQPCCQLYKPWLTPVSPALNQAGGT